MFSIKRLSRNRGNWCSGRGGGVGCAIIIQLCKAKLCVSTAEILQWISMERKKTRRETKNSHTLVCISFLIYVFAQFYMCECDGVCLCVSVCALTKRPLNIDIIINAETNAIYTIVAVILSMHLFIVGTFLQCEIPPLIIIMSYSHRQQPTMMMLMILFYRI